MNNRPIAYGVWHRPIVDRKPICLIYCPACVPAQEIDNADWITSLAKNLVICCSCGGSIKDRKDPMTEIHLCQVPRDGRDHTCTECGARYAQARTVQLDGTRDFYKAVWNAINDRLVGHNDELTRDDTNYLYAALDMIVDAAYPLPEELA